MGGNASVVSRWRFAASILAVGVVVSACGMYNTDEIAHTEPAGNTERGQQIFEDGADVIARACSACHPHNALNEAQSPSDGQKVGPTLAGISERAGLTVPGLSAEEYIRESILDPQAHVLDGFFVLMPGAYSILLSEPRRFNDALRPPGRTVDHALCRQLHIDGERTKENTAELMALYGERGSNDSTTAHWVYADGGGGFLITDGTQMELLYQDALAYSTWMELSATPIISVEEAVPQILAWVNS